MFLLLILLLISFQIGTAQYGFNHPELEWYTIETTHFKVHYHNGASWTAREVARIAEAVYEPITELYDYEPPEKTHLIIKDYNDYSNGAAYYYDNKIEIWSTPLDYLLRGSHGWLLDVVSHEFSHIISLGASMKFPRNIPAFYLQWIDYETERRKDVITGYPNVIVSYPIPGVVIPPWLAEGMAQYMYPGAGGDFWDSHRDMLLRDLVIHDKMLTFEQMNSFGKTGIGNEAVYNQGYAFVIYLQEKYGKDSLKKLSQEFKKLPSFSVDRVMKRVFKKRGVEIYRDWQGKLREKYSRILKNRQVSEDGYRLLFSRGTTSVYPVWKDSTTVYFLSNQGKDYFSQTSLYQYDLRTGKVMKLVEGVNYRVSISRDGKKIYYSRRSKPNKFGSVYQDIFCYDLEKKKEEQVTRFARAYQPALSPDGKQLIYVHGKDGSHNLILYNLETEERQQLFELPAGTQIFSPSWSPEGDRIVFDYLRTHGRDIALYDLKKKKLTVLNERPYDTRDPVFSPDGRFIYYSSDQDGIYNIYRFNLKTGGIQRLTNVAGGAFMPQIDKKGRLLFSLYDDGGYKLALLDLKHGKKYKVYTETPQIPELPPLKSELTPDTIAYELQPTHMFILPRIMMDYGTLKPGFYFYSSEVLDKMSILGGASVNRLRDKDLFLLFDYRQFKYTISLEAYYITRRVDQNLKIYQTYPSFNEIYFSLIELSGRILIPINRFNFIHLYLTSQRYHTRIKQKIDGVTYPSIGYDYFRGKSLGMEWEWRKIVPSFAMDSNPRFGFHIRSSLVGELNRFIKGLDFSKYSTLVPVFKNYDLVRIQQEGSWYHPLPFYQSGAINLEWRWGALSREVESFFKYFAGGLPGLRGYPYYSIEGRFLLTTRTTIRIPIFTQKSIRILPFSWQNLFCGLYLDWGNAWDQTPEKGISDYFRKVLQNFKKDIGFQLRLSGFSFYNYPTAISFDLVYSPDEVVIYEDNKTYRYGKEWRSYFTVLFGL